METSRSAATGCPSCWNVFEMSVRESTERVGSGRTAASDVSTGADDTGSVCARSW